MKVIRIRESFFESVLSDLFTFTMLAGLWYLNHNFLGSSGVIDFFIAFSVIIGVTNKIDTKYSVKSAVEFLQQVFIYRLIDATLFKLCALFEILVTDELPERGLGFMIIFS